METVPQGTRGPAEPRLVVISDGLAASHPLPPGVDVLIGRADDCDIQVEHPSISRQHARVRIDDTPRVEDLGSANGTAVAGRPLPANQPVEVAFGQSIELGAVTVLINRSALPDGARRLWTHGYFELLLEDRCARAAESSARFGLIRIHAADAAAASAVVEVLSPLLGSGDSVGIYGPGELELLVLDRDPDQLDELCRQLGECLGAAGIEARIGVASFPRDGTSPHALMGQANAGVHRSPRDRSVVEGGAMQSLHQMVERVAAGTIALLIRGETGVGKEVLARRIHHSSPRAERAMLAINCAAVSETLLESELFGYEKGAFTGASSSKQGLLESANGGTVFLDEVGDLPLSLQAKLLRVLQEKEVLRVGALRPRPIDVRFISATNVDLAAAVRTGTFREDLLYRLDGATLTIPPLRERVDEIEPLAERFAAESAVELGRDGPPHLSSEARAMLRRYRWPGNIRELRNVIERAVLLADDVIAPEHLPVDKMSAAPQVASEGVPGVEGAGKRAEILAALDACAGNQTRAAKLLGISRRTLSVWLDKYDIPRPTKGR